MVLYFDGDQEAIFVASTPRRTKGFYVRMCVWQRTCARPLLERESLKVDSHNIENIVTYAKRNHSHYALMW